MQGYSFFGSCYSEEEILGMLGYIHMTCRLPDLYSKMEEMIRCTYLEGTLHHFKFSFESSDINSSREPKNQHSTTLFSKN